MGVYKNKMTQTEVCESIRLQEDFPILVRTVYGEARGHGDVAMADVTHSILNRLRKLRWGSSIKEVCLAPEQYDYWSKTKADDISYPSAEAALHVVLHAIHLYQNGTDLVNGATHYHTLESSPYWADGHEPCKSDLAHHFYDDIY